MKLVSVIVPVYKAEKWIDHCISSLVGQTYSELEIILVDDGSPDQSGAFCDAWSSRDSRVRVVHKKNGGASSARNAGIDAATGEYISFVDSDDYVEKNYIECLVAEREKTQAQLVLGSYCKVDFFKREAIVNQAAVYDLTKDDITAVDAISHTSIVHVPWGKLFFRDIIQQNSIRFCEDICYSEDTIFVFQYLKYCKKISFIPDVLYYQNRVLENSLSNKYSRDMYQYRYQCFLTYADLLEVFHIKEADKDCYRASAAMEMLREMIIYYTGKKNKTEEIIFILEKCYQLYAPYFIENLKNFMESRTTLPQVKNWYKENELLILEGNMKECVTQVKLQSTLRHLKMRAKSIIKKLLVKYYLRKKGRSYEVYRIL